jgi:hypothetical protein
MPRQRAAACAERGKRAGFVVALLAACGVLGLAVSLPLWLFATKSPRLYTAAALAALGAGLATAVVRGVLRRRSLRDPSRPRGSAAAAALSVLMALVGLAAAWAAAALLVRGLWILAAIDAVVAALLITPLALLRGALRKKHKEAVLPADTRTR